MGKILDALNKAEKEAKNRKDKNVSDASNHQAGIEQKDLTVGGVSHEIG